MPLTHRITAPAKISEIGSMLWTFIVENEFDVSKHILRVECFPKEETESVCLGLQKAAAATVAGDADQHVNPFDGVIAMTLSASKCTHIMHIIQDESVFWVGLMTADSVVTKLNDKAAQQVLIEPTDTKTGEDVSATANSKAPSSEHTTN
jgi:hypothetical protein